MIKKKHIFKVPVMLVILSTLFLLNCNEKTLEEQIKDPQRASETVDEFRFFPQENPMPVGAYYYPEHWDSNNWERDIKKIAELGFEFTHFGEFAWAMMEPEEGRFEFEWLDRCVELAAENGLKVIMCTPTPTPPAWLTHNHPEVLIVNEEGRKLRHGTRLHVSGTHPVYLEYVERIVTLLAERYGDDPRIWGWQIDNEPHYRGLYDYSDHAREQFRLWLKEKYTSIDALNDAWGTAFWSMVYNDFDQIRIPNAKETESVNPHALLDFKRYNADELAEFLRFQADIFKGNISSDQFITTNYAYYKFLPSVDLFLNEDDLDFASHTMYLTNTFLNYPEGELAHRLGSGMELSFSSEFARSVNGYTGIMELQPGQINWGKWNSQPYPGAVRMWVWHSFALGDRFVCTYRFRQPLFGGEQYHKGIMETDGITVAPGGEEYVRAIAELKNIKKEMDLSVTPPADYLSRKTAFLWKQDNLWAIENSPHTSEWDPWQHFYLYYQKLKTMGSQVTFIQEDDEFDADAFRFLVAPSFSLVDQDLIHKLESYAEAGGHLIITSRTGQKDHNGQFPEELLQESITGLIGGRVDFYDHMPPGQSGFVRMDEKDYSWNIWGDILTPDEGTEVLAEYSDQFYKGRPAVIKVKKGKGSVTYIGVWTESGELEEQVLRKVYEDAGETILDLPDYVFTEWRNGFWITVNYTSGNVEAPVHEGGEIVIGERIVPPGGVAVWK